MVETTPVVIVGAGPSGLVLALSLAQLQIQSIILEKELEITDDPRGVFLAGDAVRVLWSLGVGQDLMKIGHEQTGVQFHRGSLLNRPFFKVDTQSDWRHHAVPDGIMQIQPELERLLCTRIDASSYCQLYRGCEVVSVKETDNTMLVEYRNTSGIIQQVHSSWLVGADGKRGFVRKHYLEPLAGVRQEVGLYPYEGTWIAANLHIRLPTPETHPEFPLWAAGMTPENVYDLFWPREVHFISPPGKPTASMRFGPLEARLWRHEFTEADWNDSKDATALLWDHLLPMVTRDRDDKGRMFPKTTFPQDCIEIRRCAPYAFSQKVANKWFHHRTIIIGDAAHVFPPFGGQGITAGVRDGHALAWRLAILNSLPNVERSTSDAVLSAWSSERKHGVDDSARFTRTNGQLANEAETWTHYLLRNCFTAIQSIPGVPHIRTETERAEEEAYKPVQDGFFLHQQCGGGKLAQIYVRQESQDPILSDGLLQHGKSSLTLLVVGDEGHAEAEQIVQDYDLPDSLFSKQSLVRVSFNDSTISRPGIFRPCLAAEMGPRPVKKGYDPKAYQQRLGKGVRYAVLRPDFIVHSTARDVTELKQIFEALKDHLGL